MERPVLTLRGKIGDQPLSFKLSEGIHEIGRSSSCAVRIDEPSVSRLHARLSIEGPEAVLEDLGSANGTRLNGHELDGPAVLKDGDSIAFGNFILNVNDSSSDDEMLLTHAPVRAGISVSLEEARKTSTGQRSKKAYLFSLLAEAGELMTGRQEPEAIFEPLLDLVDRALQPERIFLLLQDEPPPAMPRIVTSRLSHEPHLEAGAMDGMVLSQTLLERVLQERTAFLTEDASQDARLLSGQSIISLGTRSAMAAPLFDNEKVIGVLYADSRNPAVRYDRDELKAFVLLANVVAVAITHARYHEIEKERQRLHSELMAARGIMARLLPEDLPDIPGISLSAHLEPCEEVAGDLYDARLLPDGRLLLVVGDVSGKGLSAALLVAALLPALRLGSEGCRDPGCLIERINEQLLSSVDDVRFATLFFSLLDTRSGMMEYVNAGHNPPILVDRTGARTALDAVSPPVGMVPGIRYETRSCMLEPGQRLVLYSDGLTEAMNGKQEQYGDQRLHDLLASNLECGLEELRRRILDDVETFMAGQPPTDDLTLLLVERKATGA